MTLANAFQVAIVALAIVTLWATGNKKRWGWAVGVFSEGVWAGYAWTLRSWGLGALCVLYGILYARNWWRWRPRSRPATLPVRF